MAARSSQGSKLASSLLGFDLALSNSEHTLLDLD
jgi:hypothetical protein